MKLIGYFSVVLLVLCAAWSPVIGSVGPKSVGIDSKQAKPWRAAHLLDYNNDSALDALAPNLEKLAKQGVSDLFGAVPVRLVQPAVG